MPNITHVILTRFNIPTLGREGIIRSSPDWLANRFNLFDLFCYPSLQGQTNSNFHWIIYFDDETPEPYRSRALQYEKDCPQLKLRFGSLNDFSLERIQDDVRSRASGSDDWIVTTRLDNDDALPKDFVQRISTAAEIGRREVLNFSNGLIWRDGRIYAHTHESNAFASLSEPLDGVTTVFKAPHMELKSIAPIKQISGPAGWLQVIHGQNVSNRVRGRRVAADEIRRQFSLSKDVVLRDGGALDLIVDKAILEPIRTLRDEAIRVVKSFR